MAQKPKVGIVLAVDGEKEYTAALSRANAENQKLKSEMGLLKQQFDGQQNSMDAISARLKKLKDQQAAYNTTLVKAKEGQQNATKAVEGWKNKIDETKGKISETERKMEELERTVGKSSDAYKEQEKELEKANNELKKQEAYLQKAETSQARWGSRVATAEKNIEKCNADIKKEEQYLKEAEKATDKCATSIDSMGKKAKTAGEETKGFGSVAENALGTAVGVFAGQMLEKGVEKLAEATKKAAQYAVEVGSAFEKSMSKVEALSGASGDELDQLSQKAQDLGRSTQYSAAMVADAMSNMALAGWDTQQTLAGIDGVLQLAASSGMDLAAASDAVAGYLAAFNMEAEDAGKLADIMATAQAKSKTTADQLAEAYSTSATNMTQAGQACETTTALLEGLASVNDTGSAAGTKLSAVMAQITQKMKDGAIQIGKASVAVQDENGNFRDMIDIVEDVEKATEGLGDAERAAALQKTFNRQSTAGMNELLAVGSEQLREYQKELENSGGAAQNMADVMQDNLTGKLAAMDSATEGLGIAVYDYVSGPLSGVVEGVTKVINGITDAITPQEDAMRDFIRGVQDTNDEIAKLIGTGDETMTTNDENIAKVEAYKDMLLQSADAAQTDAFQKAQLQKIVDELGGEIPELTAAWDEQNGVLNLTTQQIERLMGAYEDSVKQKGLIDAMSSYQDAYTEAVATNAIATETQKRALEDLQKAQEDARTTGEDYIGMQGQELGQVREMREKYDEATKAVEDSATAMEESKSKLETVQGALREFTDEEEAAKNAAYYFAAEADNMADETGELATASEEMSEEVQKAYESMYKSIESAISNSISMFKEFSGGQEVTAQEVLDNLTSQIVGVSNWADNMATLAREGGESFTQEFYDYLAGMGPESANLVQMLVDTLHNDKDKFDEISIAWADSLNLQHQATELVAGATQAAQDVGTAWTDEMNSAAEVSNEEGLGAGKEYTYQWKKGVEEGKDGMTDAAQTATQEAAGAAEEEGDSFKTTGASAAESYAEGYTEKAGKISDAVVKSTDDAAKAGGEKVPQFETLGKNISAGVASGVTSNSKLIQDAVRSALQKALEAGQDEVKTYSPSHVFRDEIGRWIPAGVAVGITDNIGAVTSAATKMSKATLTASTAWIQSYRAEVRRLESSPMSSTLTNRISEGFGVSRYDTEKDKDGGVMRVLKDSEKYMSEYLSAAKKYLSNYQVLHETSLEEERAYWQEVTSHIKTGTQAYYDSMAQVKAIEEKITEQVKKSRAERLSDQETYIKHSQVLNQSSTEGELAYWQQSLDQYEEYSDEWYTIYEKINTLKKQVESEREATIAAMTTKGQINALTAENKQLRVLLEGSSASMLEKAEAQRRLLQNATKLRELAIKQENEDLASWEKYINRKSILYGEDLSDELAFWQSKITQLDRDGDAYLSVFQKIQKIREDLANVASQYYEKKISEAEAYVNREKILHNMSEKQELDYWQKQIQTVVYQSDAYVEIYSKIKNLKESIKATADATAQAEVQRLNNRVNLQSRLLSRYKQYYKLSARAEMEYWDKVRQGYKEGTTQRIEADSNYLQAAQSYYDQLAQLAEDYKDKQKKIDDELADQVKGLTDEYEKAVDDRKKAILNGMNLWDAYDTEGFTGDELLKNMQSQTDALKLYAREWEDLVAKGLPEELLKEIEEMGTSATANIYSLNRMTEDDLQKWISLWKEKNEIAERQAKIDNQHILEDARSTITQLTTEAQKAYRDIVDEYNRGVQELSGSLPKQLEQIMSMISNAKMKWTEEKVDAQIKNLKGVTVEVDPEALKAQNAIGWRDYEGLYSENRANGYLSELSDILTDSEFTQLVDDQRLVYQELADVSDRLVTEWQQGIESLNNLVGITAGGQQVQAQDTRQLELLANILGVLERMGGRGTGGQVVLDTGALVGAIYPEISEMAAERTQQITRTQR